MDIQSGKQVPVLLSVMGPKTYCLLCNVVAPNKPRSMRKYCGCFARSFCSQATGHSQKFPVPQDESVGRRNSHTVCGGSAKTVRTLWLWHVSDFCFVCEFKGETVQKHLLKESLFTMSVVVSKLKSQTIFGEEHKLWDRRDSDNNYDRSLWRLGAGAGRGELWQTRALKQRRELSEGPKRQLQVNLIIITLSHLTCLQVEIVWRGNVRQRSRWVLSAMQGGRQERLALLGGKKLLVAANQNPAELVMVRLGRWAPDANKVSR